MLPFPGDWHTLKNLQPVLMKIYWDGGLKDVASTIHKSHTLRSLQVTSNFKRTHRFFLQSWEAFYLRQLEQFVKSSPASAALDAIESVVTHCDQQGESVSSGHFEHLSSSLPELYHQFCVHRKAGTDADETTRFWDHFIHKDMFIYVGLWLAIRRGDWQQRVTCLKETGPLFQAFDRTTYQALIPQHLADLCNFPQEVLDSLKLGGFVANISGKCMMSVALDETKKQRLVLFEQLQLLFLSSLVTCLTDLLCLLMSSVRSCQNKRPV